MYPNIFQNCLRKNVNYALHNGVSLIKSIRILQKYLANTGKIPRMDSKNERNLCFSTAKIFRR